MAWFLMGLKPATDGIILLLIAAAMSMAFASAILGWRADASKPKR